MIDISKKKECEYYPCHFDGQDCTWCYCPFYPCSDSATGGKFTISRRTGKKVWSCIDCRWIHERRVAEKVLTELRKHWRTSDVKKILRKQDREALRQQEREFLAPATLCAYLAVRQRILGEGNEG